MKRLLILSLVLLALACDSPTDPEDIDISGRWTGNLGQQAPTLEDWTSVTIDLTQNGDEVTGALRERNGRVHPLRGTRSSVEVTDIPSLGQNACSRIVLGFSREERNTIRGSLSGRCHGTLLAQFVLTRV